MCFLPNLCLIYVFTEVIKPNKVTGSTNNAECFVIACTVTRSILHILKKREVTANDLEQLELFTKRIGPLLAQSQSDVKKPVQLNIPKIHSVIHYRFYLIL